MVGYCEQTDIHTATTTVREALVFSAALRTPIAMSEVDRSALLEEVLSDLELNSIGDRVVGPVARPKCLLSLWRATADQWHALSDCYMARHRRPVACSLS